jgi:XTP/dITP diphosphohydrolase
MKTQFHIPNSPEKATLLIASNNPGKLREVKAILAILFDQSERTVFNVVTPVMLGLHLDVNETGSTYAENAALKAAAFGQALAALGLPGRSVVMADDSGLEVDALGGAPGIHSARFTSIPGATDADRRAALCQRLEIYDRPWEARFTCTVAVMRTGESAPRFAAGDCRGQIIPEERGSGGFGYDPIFLVEDRDLTMAELSMDEKNVLSHRARALRLAGPLIADLFGIASDSLS